MAHALSRRISRALLIVTGVAIASVSQSAMADVKAGVDAWEAGDYQLAVQQWVGPAEQGDADALYNLGQAYRLGRGVSPDINRAREFYAAAAAKGHIKAADNYALLLFQQGEQERAMPMIRAAAGRGDPRAQYYLGLSHFNADFAERDWVRAYALVTLANSAGLPPASGALTQMDQYIPMPDREQAQVLARELDAEAKQRNAAALAAEGLRRAPDRAEPVPDIAATSRGPVSVAVPASSAAAPARMEPLGPNAASGVTTSVASANQAVSPAASSAANGAAVLSSVPTEAPAPEPTPARAATSDGPWRVQLGAFGVASNAERMWESLAGRSEFAGKRKLLLPTGRVTRLQAGGFATRADAVSACEALKLDGKDCLVTQR